VAGWIPMARATGLYGAAGEGKTLLEQMLATSCAVNATWLGLPVRQCRSLLFFCINQYIFQRFGLESLHKISHIGVNDRSVGPDVSGRCPPLDQKLKCWNS
jgi:hypothetical protein